LPCLDVHNPPFSARRIFKMFRCHRRTSHERRNPIWNDDALAEGRARLGRLHTNHRRQDKAGHPASGAVRLKACLHVVSRAASCSSLRGTCWLLKPFPLCIQRSERRRTRIRLLAATPERPFLRHATTRAICLLQVLVRLPIVMPWHAMMTTFDYVLARSATRVMPDLADAACVASAPVRPASRDRSSKLSAGLEAIQPA
jgi:hypothetical protein